MDFPVPTTTRTPEGKVSRPQALVDLKLPDGSYQPMSFIVDSGADVTILPFSAGDMLGKEVKKGERFPIGGIQGSLDVYLHEIEAELGGHGFRMTVAIAESDTVPYLLGRMNTFDVFDITFKQRILETSFLKSTTPASTTTTGSGT
jgi:hypothetical protein